MDPSAIPVIDHADLVSDRPEALARAAEAIATGLGTYGLVYVRGHEIQRQRVLELYDRFLEVLDRPGKISHVPTGLMWAVVRLVRLFNRHR